MAIDFNEYFYYDETSPSCLRWKISTSNVLKDSVVGTLRPDNTWRVSLKRKQYYISRVIWEMFIDKVSDDEIVRFKDGDSSNTRIDNLLKTEKVDTPVLTIEDVFNRVEYDESSPTCLRWKCYAGKRLPGTVAGSMAVGNRWQIKVGVKMFLVHRLIWNMFYGEIPEGMAIDHINGDSLDNRISNLRVVTAAINNRNKKKTINNKSGVVGVYFTLKNGKNPVWISGVKCDGVWHNTFFSVNEYGNDLAFKMACEWRENKVRELNLAGAGFTDRHIFG